MIHAVLDTNLLVSYLLTNGETITRIVKHWEAGRFVSLQSPHMLAELVDVLNRPRLRQYLKAAPQILIDLIATDAEFVKGELALSGACRDPKDDKFIACAVEGSADYLVTGDKDLLVLGVFQHVQIVRAWEFLKLLDELP